MQDEPDSDSIQWQKIVNILLPENKEQFDENTSWVTAGIKARKSIICSHEKLSFCSISKLD